MTTTQGQLFTLTLTASMHRSLPSYDRYIGCSVLMVTKKHCMAQVEEMLDPTLKGKPLGVRQKQIIVTCNYAARARGVTKCMFLKDALEVCPELELRCGEDLAVYRRCSAAVTASLAASGCPVERLGLDENWVDVSKLVVERLRNNEEVFGESKGNVVGGSLTCSVHGCGPSCPVSTG